MKTATIQEFFRDRFGDHGMERVWNWIDEKIVDPQEDFSSSDEDEDTGNNANPYAPGSDKWPTEPHQDNEKDASINGNVSSGDGDDGGGGNGSRNGGGAGVGGGTGGKRGKNGAPRNVLADAAVTKKAPLTPLEKELQEKNQELQDRLSKVEMALALASTPLPAMTRPAMTRHDEYNEYERGELQSQWDSTPRSTTTSIGGTPFGGGRHPRRKKVSVQHLPPVSVLPGQRMGQYTNWPVDTNPPYHIIDNHADTSQLGIVGNPVTMVPVHSQPTTTSSNQQSKIHPTSSTYDSPSSRK